MPSGTFIARAAVTGDVNPQANGASDLAIPVGTVDQALALKLVDVTKYISCGGGAPRSFNVQANVALFLDGSSTPITSPNDLPAGFVVTSAAIKLTASWNGGFDDYINANSSGNLTRDNLDVGPRIQRSTNGHTGTFTVPSSVDLELPITNLGIFGAIGWHCAYTSAMNLSVDRLVIEGTYDLAVWITTLPDPADGPQPSTMGAPTPGGLVGPAECAPLSHIQFGAQPDPPGDWQDFGSPGPQPVVDSVFPRSGTRLGGTPITVRGAQFDDLATVTIGGLAADDVVVVSQYEITCTTPLAGSPTAHAEGVVPVVVHNSDGTDSTALSPTADDFEYLELLAVVAITAAFGPDTGGTAVQVLGNGFRAGSTVDVGGNPATSVVVQSAQLITAVTPAGSGVADVLVTNPDTNTSLLAAAFTYLTAEELATLRFGASGGLDCVRYGSVRFQESRGQPRQGTLRTTSLPDDTRDVQIIAGGQVLITGVYGKITQLTEGKLTQLAWDVELVDYVARLNGVRPVGSWTDTSVSAIVSEILSRSAPGFTAHVEGGLPATTIQLDGSADFASVLSELAARASVDEAVQWFVDGVDVWFFATYTGPNAPSVLDDDNPWLVRTDDAPVRLSYDYSQIRNRVKIVGAFNVVVTAEDAASQAQYGLRERIYRDTADGPDAGSVQALLQQKADAELEAFKDPIPTLEYAIRDLNHRPGLTVVANLTNPPVNVSLLIQQVTIDQVGLAKGIRYEPGMSPRVQLPVRPRVQVTAYPVGFGFGDLMRATANAVAGSGTGGVLGEGGGLSGVGGSLPAPNLRGQVHDSDVADDCLSSDKLSDSGVVAGTYGGGGSP